MINEPTLAQLHDIHLPKAIQWWPLAPGWYLLAAIILTVCSTSLIWLYRRYTRNKAKRLALRLLITIERDHLRDGDSQLSSTRVSELLRRVAIAYYPRTQVAKLHGKAWVVFLNTSAKNVDFNTVYEQLIEWPYRPKHTHELHRLFEITRQWIKQQGSSCSN